MLTESHYIILPGGIIETKLSPWDLSAKNTAVCTLVQLEENHQKYVSWST